MFDAMRNALASPLRLAKGLTAPGSSWSKLGERDEESAERIPVADKENARTSDFSFQSKTPLAKRTPLSAINGGGELSLLFIAAFAHPV
jgi:hypothetical protein